MRKLVLIAVLSLLCGCAAYTESLKDSYGGLFQTKAQREAADSAKCQGYGAQPGSDVFVTCMVGLAQVRASNAAADAASANRSASFQQPSLSPNPFSNSTIALPNGRTAYCQSYTNGAGTQTTCN